MDLRDDYDAFTIVAGHTLDARSASSHAESQKNQIDFSAVAPSNWHLKPNNKIEQQNRTF